MFEYHERLVHRIHYYAYEYEGDKYPDIAPTNTNVVRVTVTHGKFKGKTVEIDMNTRADPPKASEYQSSIFHLAACYPDDKKRIGGKTIVVCAVSYPDTDRSLKECIEETTSAINMQGTRIRKDAMMPVPVD